MPIDIGMEEKIIRNRIRCKKCGSIIESTYRHDYKECRCRSCAVDGGHAYLRRCFTERGVFEELSEAELVGEVQTEKCNGEEEE